MRRERRHCAGAVRGLPLHRILTPLATSSYGSFRRANEDETEVSLRILVDHSIVEIFVQGGNISITSRVYPTLTLEDDARVDLFNNGSADISAQVRCLEHVHSVHDQPIRFFQT